MSSDVDLCIANLQIKLGITNAVARVALDKHVEKVFQVSTQTYCPVDTGALKGSARNYRMKDEPDTYERRISYGGGSSVSDYTSLEHGLTQLGTGNLLMKAGTVSYAIFVHEKPGAHHNPSEACWKYLERAVNEYQDDLYQELGVVSLTKTSGGRRPGIY